MDTRQIWEKTANKLEKIYDKREAASISRILLEELFGITHEDIMLSIHIPIDVEKLENAILRLLKFEPLQYITKTAFFYGRKFTVSKEVLIPRPETEELVEIILKENSLYAPRILDIGTGSGCIAISLELKLKSEVFGLDVSESILNVAKHNAQHLNAHVKFLLGDIFKFQIPIENLDIIVSNPPYIPQSEKKNMNPNVSEYEPTNALFVPTLDPLIFYRKIIKIASTLLNKKGFLYFEINETFGFEVMELLKCENFKNIRLFQDMQGKDRIVRAVKA